MLKIIDKEKCMRYCLKCIVLLLTIAMVLSGCKSKTDEDTQTEKKPAEQTTQTPQPEVVQTDVTPQIQHELPAEVSSETVDTSSDRVVVIVDGVEITERQVQARVAPMMAQTKRMPENLVAQYEKTVREKALNDLIIESILDRKIVQVGIEVTDADVDVRISELNAQNNMSQKDFLEMLQAMGQDFTQYKNTLRKNIGYERLMKAKFSDVELIQEEFKERSANYILELKDKAKIVYPPIRRAR